MCQYFIEPSRQTVPALQRNDSWPVRRMAGFFLLMLAGCSSTPPVMEPAITEALVTVDPPEVTAQFDRAVTLLGAGDLDLAVRELESMSTAYPEYSGPLVNLGIAYVKSGHLPEAEQAFQMAIARNASNASAFNQLGIVYRKLGRFTDAASAYHRALEVAPGYAFAHFNLGVLHDLYLQQPDKALVHYESYVALAVAPDAVVIGWIADLKSRLGATTRTARSDP